MCGHTHDVVIHSKLHRNRPGILAPRGVEMWTFPLLWLLAFTTSCTTVQVAMTSQWRHRSNILSRYSELNSLQCIFRTFRILKINRTMPFLHEGRNWDLLANAHGLQLHALDCGRRGIMACCRRTTQCMFQLEQREREAWRGVFSGAARSFNYHKRVDVCSCCKCAQIASHLQSTERCRALHTCQFAP